MESHYNHLLRGQEQKPDAFICLFEIPVTESNVTFLRCRDVNALFLEERGQGGEGGGGGGVWVR